MKEWRMEGPVVAKDKLLEQHDFGTHHCRQIHSRSKLLNMNHSLSFPVPGYTAAIFPRSYGS